jgi:F-type H+-transporting ATPase subunit epsilon
MAAIRCTVVAPERPLFEGGAEKVVVPGTKGQIGVLPGHAPLIAKLEPGVIRIHRPADEGGAVEKMAVAGGFVQVTGNVITLLVTEAVTSADVDEAAVRRALDEVLEKLRHPASDEEYRSNLLLRRSLKAQLSLVE